MENITIKFPESAQLTDDQLFDFCVTNKELRIERDTKGQLIVMSPVGGLGSSHNLAVASLLWLWNSRSNTGIVFDSSGGFRLPNGAMRSPDAAWINLDRWNQLSADDREKFPPLTPDFVIEVRSKSDGLRELKLKMSEWMENGCRLAWLIDPVDQKAYIYLSSGEIKIINSFDTIISAKTIVPGFELDLSILK